MSTPLYTQAPPVAIKVKTSNGWADLVIQGPPGQGVPIGGALGTVLAKKSATDYDTQWQTIPPALPAGGATGQALLKKTATDYDTQWGTAGADLVYDGDYASGPTYKDGEIVVYNGIAYLCTMPTSSPPAAWPGGPTLAPWPKPAYGTSLPVSPVDGQEAVLVDSLTAPTYQWTFRYNAGSTATAKWEFVGGVPWTGIGGSISTAANTWSDLTSGPTFTVPRAGIYHAECGAFMQTTAYTAQYNAYIGVLGSTAGRFLQITFVPTGQFGGATCYGIYANASLVASESLKLQVNPTGGGTTSFSQGMLKITPVRVS